MHNPPLHQLALVIALTWPAAALGNTPAADDGCSLAAAETAFVRGLGAFRGEGLAPAELLSLCQGPGAENARRELEQAEACFARAVQCHPGHGSALYWLGVTYLRQGKPHAAVEKISQSLAAEETPRTDRWRILAHLGAAALEAGDPSTAARKLAAARRELEKFPDQTDARPGAPSRRRPSLNQSDAEALYSLGEALAKLGARRAGEKLMAQARRLEPDVETSTGKNAEVALPKYRGPFWSWRGPWRWDGRLGISTGPDSNPSALDAKLSVNSLEGEAIQGSDGDEVQDLDFRVAAYRLATADDPRRNDLPSFGWTLQGYQSLHQDLDDLDVGQGRAVLQVAWGKDPSMFVSGPLGYTRVPYGWSRTSVLLQVGYVHTRLAEETFFQGAGAAVSITVRGNRLTDSQVELAYQDFDFEDASLESRDRSGSLWLADVSQIFYLKRRDRYVRLGLRGADRVAGRAYARSFIEPYFETALPLRSRWRLLLSGSVLYEDFDHPESNLFLPDAGTQPREDTTLRAAATLVWSPRPTWRLFASVSHTNRDSELELPTGVPSLDYERTRSLLGFKWFFGSGD